MVAAISTHFKKRLYQAVDAADKESCRPDFAEALYPGHMLENASKDFELNPYVPVTGKPPPTFLLEAEDDAIDTVQNSLRYYTAVEKARIPVESTCMRRVGMHLGCAARSCRSRDGLSWWKT